MNGTRSAAPGDAGADVGARPAVGFTHQLDTDEAGSDGLEALLPRKLL
jgi:hypothetical protein